MFQFLNGSINMTFDDLPILRRTSFNSSMVRLILVCSCHQPFVVGFQFLNGSINMEEDGETKTMDIKFQFLNGSINIFQSDTSPNEKNAVSIPQWFD